MFLPIEISPATVVIIALIIAGCAAVIYKLAKNGLCNCKKCTGDCTSRLVCNSATSCPDCQASANMIENIEAAVGGKLGRSLDDTRGLS